MTWSEDCVIVYTDVADQNAKFPVTKTTLYDAIALLSTQYNANLLQQLKSGFKRVINWNKYLWKQELWAHNSNVNHFVKPSFQRINRLFVLALEDDIQKTSIKRYCLPNVEIKH